MKSTKEVFVPDSEPSVLEAPRLLSEFLGVFAFTYVSCWTVIGQELGYLSYLTAAIAQTLSLIALSNFSLGLSESHLNPALTIGLVVIKKIDWTAAVFFLMAQFLGGITAGGFVFIQLNSVDAKVIENKSVIGLPMPGSTEYGSEVIWGESLGAFFLMYVYMAIQRENLPFGMGLSYFFLTVALGEIGGGSFNPARTIGPAMIVGRVSTLQFRQLFSPIAGAIAASVIYNSIFAEDEDDAMIDEAKEAEKERLKEEPVKNIEMR